MSLKIQSQRSARLPVVCNLRHHNRSLEYLCSSFLQILSNHAKFVICYDLMYAQLIEIVCLGEFENSSRNGWAQSCAKFVHCLVIEFQGNQKWDYIR